MINQIINNLNGTEQAVLLWIGYLLVANLMWLIVWAYIRNFVPPKDNFLDICFATIMAIMWPVLAIMAAILTLGTIIFSPVLLYYGCRVLIQNHHAKKAQREAQHTNEIKALLMKNKALQDQSRDISSKLVSTQCELKDARDQIAGFEYVQHMRPNELRASYPELLKLDSQPRSDELQRHLTKAAEDMARQIDNQYPYGTPPLKFPGSSEHPDWDKHHVGKTKYIYDPDAGSTLKIRKEEPKKVKHGMLIYNPVTKTTRKATMKEMIEHGYP